MFDRTNTPLILLLQQTAADLLRAAADLQQVQPLGERPGVNLVLQLSAIQGPLLQLSPSGIAEADLHLFR